MFILNQPHDEGFGLTMMRAKRFFRQWQNTEVRLVPGLDPKDVLGDQINNWRKMADQAQFVYTSQNELKWYECPIDFKCLRLAKDFYREGVLFFQ